MFGRMPQLSGNDKENITALYDYVTALRRELNDMLFNLDSENIREINAEIVNVYNLNAANIKANTIMSNVNMIIGSGNNVFKADPKGIYLGDAHFEDAPFSVDMEGNLYAESATIEGIFRTGMTGARVILNNNGITSYNSSNNLHGLQCNPSSIYPEISLYRNGSEIFTAKAMNDGSLGLEGKGHTIFYSDGYTVETVQDFDFSLSDVTGLEDSGYASQYFVDRAIEDVMDWVEDNFEPKV
jgi:hypothetical protein